MPFSQMSTQPRLLTAATLSRWEILAHIFNHSTDYRSRVLMMLALLGVQAPSIELLDYLRNNKQLRERIAMESFHKEAPI